MLVSDKPDIEIIGCPDDRERHPADEHPEDGKDPQEREIGGEAVGCGTEAAEKEKRDDAKDECADRIARENNPMLAKCEEDIFVAEIYVGHVVYEAARTAPSRIERIRSVPPP